MLQHQPPISTMHTTALQATTSTTGTQLSTPPLHTTDSPIYLLPLTKYVLPPPLIKGYHLMPTDAITLNPFSGTTALRTPPFSATLTNPSSHQWILHDTANIHLFSHFDQPIKSPTDFAWHCQHSPALHNPPCGHIIPSHSNDYINPPNIMQWCQQHAALTKKIQHMLAWCKMVEHHFFHKLHPRNVDDPHDTLTTP